MSTPPKEGFNCERCNSLTNYLILIEVFSINRRPRKSICMNCLMDLLQYEMTAETKTWIKRDTTGRPSRFKF